ncbi:hypothetical protein W97_08160 [Coniosporium apollinis CBS 100218]|uniref:Methyltransferase small domain-containing protein n=1 Tax=Coniosporium apollinis (strain CBS 100218) TaxID=1168221 RepID=R7Z406_CONA1|nr:uncharacterized protein W97_08160 [Coniosporium apollinis CBS 100218]EON68902.1 hypothetical protein W97_08160 [Coniosporium apollinis CBS 100218]
MLPTPSTSHASFDNVYEPAEDSFLLLDTLSASSETNFLRERFGQPSSATEGTVDSPQGAPLIVEVGAGSGVVLAFVNAHADVLFGHRHILTLGTDINSFACRATRTTAEKASAEAPDGHGNFLDAVNMDLTAAIRPGTVDVLVFNPPYVPTAELPNLSQHLQYNTYNPVTGNSFEQDSHLLALSYAGGVEGMETTNRLIEQLPEVLHPERGVAYLLLCAQNKPEKVKEHIRGLGAGWLVETVGSSGKQGGWEKLQILRIWRAGSPRAL